MRGTRRPAWLLVAVGLGMLALTLIALAVGEALTPDANAGDTAQGFVILALAAGSGAVVSFQRWR